VLGLRWTDTVRVALGAEGLLPPVPPFALVVITGFGLLDVAIITRFAVRLWFRRQVRQLWRFPVRIPATVEGSPSTCLDLHQRGAAVSVDGALAVRDSLTIHLELTTSEGRRSAARGRLTPTSRLPLPDGSIRVGGPVVWDDRDSRLAVIERCYVVEPYGARRAFLQRRAPRFSVTLPARIGKARARTIDVSDFGAAFRCSARLRFAPGSRHRVVVLLRGGRREAGWFTVLNARTDGSRQRVGGEMEWHSTAWIGPGIQGPAEVPALRPRAEDLRVLLALGLLARRWSARRRRGASF